jgi:hypothetical protein
MTHLPQTRWFHQKSKKDKMDTGVGCEIEYVTLVIAADLLLKMNNAFVSAGVLVALILQVYFFCSSC